MIHDPCCHLSKKCKPTAALLIYVVWIDASWGSNSNSNNPRTFRSAPARPSNAIMAAATAAAAAVIATRANVSATTNYCGCSSCCFFIWNNFIHLSSTDTTLTAIYERLKTFRSFFFRRQTRVLLPALFVGEAQPYGQEGHDPRAPSQHHSSVMVDNIHYELRSDCARADYVDKLVPDAFHSAVVVLKLPACF